jgi:3'-5' exoribonuclease 1
MEEVVPPVYDPEDPEIVCECPRLDYILVVDIEATCGCDAATMITPYNQEIIEIPCVVVRTATAEIIAKHDIIVRPTMAPTLTAFCTALTGIRQADVDRALDLWNALHEFDDFVRHTCAGGTYCIATDGEWDVPTMLFGECARKCISPRPYWRKFFDVRAEFANLYRPAGYCSQLSLTGMLDELGMEFIGRRHSGIDDARNIARIVCSILADDVLSWPTAKFPDVLRSFTAPRILV